MLDLSFTGGSVIIEAQAIGRAKINGKVQNKNVEITEFSDEGSPVEVDEIEVTGHSITMNGTLIRWRKPSAFTAKVTVIPGSDADESLTKLLLRSRVQPTGRGVFAQSVSDLVTTMTIKSPQINLSGGEGGSSVAGGNSSIAEVNTWVFSQGCIVSGAPAVTSDAEGKMQAKTFSFVFERMEKFDDKGLAIVAGESTL